MNLLKVTLGVTVLLAVAKIGYDNLPLHTQYELSDWYKSLGTPTFTESPDYFAPRAQEEIIAENRARGHELECYGNLGPAERISASNDYLCSAHISSAYDNIPARLVTFFFGNGKLQNVRIEFAADSFPKLQNYLSRKLADYPRIDNRYGTDSFGKPLVVWRVKYGQITASAEETAGQNPIILWTAYR
jgi:hypothetical protein